METTLMRITKIFLRMWSGLKGISGFLRLIYGHSMTRTNNWFILNLVNKMSIYQSKKSTDSLQIASHPQEYLCNALHYRFFEFSNLAGHKKIIWYFKFLKNLSTTSSTYLKPDALSPSNLMPYPHLTWCLVPI